MLTSYLIVSCLTAALKHFQSQLTEYEQEEIMDYTEIWYLGLDTKKIQGCQGSSQNSGYDDEHGSYLKVNSFNNWTLNNRTFLQKVFFLNHNIA